MFTSLGFNPTIFILASILSFTFPGLLLLKPLRHKFSFWENLVLATVVGFTAFSIIGYLVLSIKLTFLLIPLIIIADLFAFKLLNQLKKSFSLPSKERLIILILIFFFGILGQLLIIAPSGVFVGENLVFWSSHGHDASWHIALMEEIKKGFPMQNPLFAGEKLVNYHFFSDISPALFNFFLNIPVLDLYFRFFPFLFSLCLGCLAYFLGKRVGGSFSSGIWATIFTYFAGSFGYFVTYAQSKTIAGESLFWGSQIQSSIGNLPLIESLVITLSFLLIFKTFLEEGNHIALFLILSILLGTLSEFKSYAGVVIVSSLAIVGLWQLIKERKVWILTSALIASITSLILYFPNSKNISQFLIFEPWWFIRTMTVAPDRLNWIDLELRRQTYIADGNWKRVIQIELTGFFIFFFGNLGMKFLGIWEFIKILKSSLRNYFNLNLIIICLISLILPLLFLQKGVAGNTIQFLQYFLLIFGILAGVSISKLFQKIHSKFLQLLLIIIIVLISIPTQVGLIVSFYSRAPLAKITKLELNALNYLRLKTQPNNIILTPPFSRDNLVNEPTLPIWTWSDTGYVSAFSSRRTYLSDNEQITIMDYDLSERLNFQKTVFTQTNIENLEQILKDHKIDYLYFPVLQRPKIDLSKTQLIRIFSNSEVEIWKI